MKKVQNGNPQPHLAIRIPQSGLANQHYRFIITNSFNTEKSHAERMPYTVPRVRLG
jgi:hypothetical protein